MAKEDISLSGGRLTGKALAKYYSKLKLEANSKKIKQPGYEKGIRQRVVEVYYAQGILEAYKILEEYNKKFSKPVYTREMFETWIAEENRRSKGNKMYDGFDR